MRPTLLALALSLSACGAESNAPPSTAPDAAADAPADAVDAAPGDGAFSCPLPSEVFFGGRCVSGSNANCNGRMCAAGQTCTAVIGTVDGGFGVTAVMCQTP